MDEEVSSMNREKYEEIKKRILRRDPFTNKSDFGKALIIGSSSIYPLASLIAERAADIIRPGYVGLAVPETVRSVAFNRARLTTVFPRVKTEGDTFHYAEFIYSSFDSILFGNGIEVSKKNYEYLRQLIRNYEYHLVLDAGALALLSDYGSEILKEKNKNLKILLTPHLGEARYLFHEAGLRRDIKDYLPHALKYCEEYGVSILLKSFETYLISERGAKKLNTKPTAVLAKAGTGDALSGLIVALLALPLKDLEYEDIVEYANILLNSEAVRLEEETGRTDADVLDVLERLEKSKR